MAKEFKPYIWFKAKVFKSSEPYVKIPVLSPRNYVGSYGLKSEKDFMNDLNYKCTIMFPVKRIILTALAPYMRAYFDPFNKANAKVKIMYDDFIKYYDRRETYDTAGEDTMRSWSQVKKNNVNLANTYLEEEINQKLNTKAERFGNTPTHKTDIGVAPNPPGYDPETQHKTDIRTFQYKTNAATLPVAKKLFVMTSSEIDWMVRADKVWLEQSKGLKINIPENQKPYLTNVVGGPKLKTKFGREQAGLFNFTPPSILITLGKSLVSKGNWTRIHKDFNEMLVHEYTHFIQLLYVKTLGDRGESFWNLPSINNVNKYYRSMWERDAYAVQYLWMYLRDKGLPLQVLAQPEVLKINFNEEALKTYIDNNATFRWHKNRITDPKLLDIFLRGLVYSAKQFVNSQQSFAPQNEKQDKVLDFKPQFRADVISEFSQNSNRVHLDKNLYIEECKAAFKPEEVKAEMQRQSIGSKSFDFISYAANVNGIVYENSLSDAIRCANYFAS